MAQSCSWSGCLLGGAMLVLACSSEGPSTISSGGPASGNPTGTPTGEPRSFRKDVFPLLTGSCALSYCHGDRSGNPGVGIFLPIGDPDGVYADLMGESTIAKGSKFVVPGDPAKSFLYAKMTGDMTSFRASCPATGCGDVMPPGKALGAKELDTLKKWIAEGARNN